MDEKETYHPARIAKLYIEKQIYYRAIMFFDKSTKRLLSLELFGFILFLALFFGFLFFGKNIEHALTILIYGIFIGPFIGFFFSVVIGSYMSIKGLSTVPIARQKAIEYIDSKTYVFKRDIKAIEYFYNKYLNNIIIAVVIITFIALIRENCFHTIGWCFLEIVISKFLQSKAVKHFGFMLNGIAIKTKPTNIVVQNEEENKTDLEN